MKVKSPQFSVLSGSLAGAVGSRNKGGMYLRNRGVPTKPRSPRQLAVRTALSNATNAWSSALDGAQRNGWEQFAQTNPVPDTIGNNITLSGHQMFMKVMIPLYTFDSVTPTVFDSPGNVPFLPAPQGGTSITISAATGEITGQIEFQDNYETGDKLALLITRPCSTGRTPVHEPNQFIALRTLTAAMTPTNVYDFGAAPFIDPFFSVPGRLENSPYEITIYWYRDNNISSVFRRQGTCGA